MKRIILIILFITLTTTSIIMAAPVQQKQKEKILIVLLDSKKGQPSWFKQSIIDSLKTIYQVDVIEGKKPQDIKASEYKAVVVMDQLKAWLMGNGKLKNYTKVMDPRHTVYFVTSGDKNWKWKKEGITAITSASTPAKIPELVKKLREEIFK
jgi:hypothetical protein